MKKLLFALVVLTTSIFISSCSKKEWTENYQPRSASLTAAGLHARPNLSGSVTGRIDPALTAPSLVIYNENLYQGPFYPDSRSGIFKIENLPGGNYRLVITYETGSQNDRQHTQTSFTIEVEITPGTITDLGTIAL